VAEDQAEFEIGETAGTLIGFWSPHFVGFSLTLPGFHFHFLAGKDASAAVCCLLTWLLFGSRFSLTLPGFHFHSLAGKRICSTTLCFAGSATVCARGLALSPARPALPLHGG
jgi:hypothetical protein